MIYTGGSSSRYRPTDRKREEGNHESPKWTCSRFARSIGPSPARRVYRALGSCHEKSDYRRPLSIPHVASGTILVPEISIPATTRGCLLSCRIEGRGYVSASTPQA